MKWPKNMKMCAIAHGNGGWKHEKDKFLRRLSNQVSMVTIAGKSSRETENVCYSPWNGQKTWKLWAIAHENGGSKHEIREFLRRFSNHVTVVNVAGNRPGNRKMCAITHEIAKKTWKLWAIAHGNGGRKWEKHEFLLRLSNQVSMVTLAGNHLGNKKMCSMAHDMGRKHEKCEL
jgi:hypothetical protein